MLVQVNVKEIQNITADALHLYAYRTFGANTRFH